MTAIPMGQGVNPVQPSRPSFKAFFALGFRPFYLLGSLYAALSVILWALYWSGTLVFEPALAGTYWHVHEMIFGVVMAFVAGFLLTAVRVWTGKDTPSGLALAGIVGLWGAARLAIYVGNAPMVAILDAIFMMTVAVSIGRPIIAAANWRNLFAPLVLTGFALAGVSFTLATDYGTGAEALRSVAVDLLTFLVAVIGGRVIPFFTGNALPQARPRRLPWLDRLSLGSLLALLVLDLGDTFLPVPTLLLAGVVAAAAAAHTLRLGYWNPLATRKVPLLWVLMLAYAWLPVALLMRGLSLYGLADPVLALHALLVGTVSGLVIGMITRTARGHTGRPLKAERAEVAMYAAMFAAAFTRVVVPMLWPDASMIAVDISALLWGGTFLTYAITYGPHLVRPRPDGRPG